MATHAGAHDMLKNRRGARHVGLIYTVVLHQIVKLILQHVTY